MVLHVRIQLVDGIYRAWVIQDGKKGRNLLAGKTIRSYSQARIRAQTEVRAFYHGVEKIDWEEISERAEARP